MERLSTGTEKCYLVSSGRGRKQQRRKTAHVVYWWTCLENPTSQKPEQESTHGLDLLSYSLICFYEQSLQRMVYSDWISSASVHNM